MSDHDDAVAKGVLLLKTIGLDITYTDEGLEVIVRQIMRLGIKAARDAVDALYVPGWPPTNADVLAAIDGVVKP